MDCFLKRILWIKTLTRLNEKNYRSETRRTFDDPTCWIFRILLIQQFWSFYNKEVMKRRACFHTKQRTTPFNTKQIYSSAWNEAHVSIAQPI